MIRTVCSLIILFLVPLLSLHALDDNPPCLENVPPAPAYTGQNIWVGTSKTVYEIGEYIEFTFISNQSGRALYRLRRDTRLDPMLSAFIDLQANVPYTYTLQACNPEFLMMEVEMNFQSSRVVVGSDPCNIEPSEAAPAEFDEFWNPLLAQLSEVPLESTIEYRPDYSTFQQDAYKFSVNNIDGRRVQGFMSIPLCSGPLPAILVLPPYGYNPIIPYTWIAAKGAIVVSISVHDWDPEQFVPTDVGYQPLGNFLDRNTNYYKWSILGAVRAIDFIFSLPEFNGQDVAVIGKSQGGGLAVMTAGLDSRVNVLAQSQGALSDHTGLFYRRSSGFPQYIFDYLNCETLGCPLGGTIEQVILETSFYDVVHFAPRFSGTSFNAIGHLDDTCPPSSVYAFYNQFTGPKSMLHVPDRGHAQINDVYDSQELSFLIEQLNMVGPPECENSPGLTWELNHFEGTRVERGVALEWTLDQEWHVDHVVLEKADQLEEGFYPITQVALNNATRGLADFDYTDEAFNEEAYYRLKLVKLNGQESYSRLLHKKEVANNADLVQVFPNPVQRELTFQRPAEWSSALEVLVLDVSGNKFIHQQWPADQPQLTIDINSLSIGSYIYQILSDGAFLGAGKVVKE